MEDFTIHYCDMLAIPLFLLMFHYFYTKKNKNNIEYLLLFFAFIGFAVDTWFSYKFINKL
jgi:hypothetical protein